MTGVSSERTRLGVGELLVADLSNVTLSGPSGVVWALDSPQLNANLVTILPGDEILDHVNGDVDVLILVESGSGELVVDGSASTLGSASLALIPKGSRRAITSANGMAYYSIHQRRPGLVLGDS